MCIHQVETVMSMFEKCSWRHKCCHQHGTMTMYVTVNISKHWFRVAWTDCHCWALTYFMSGRFRDMENIRVQHYACMFVCVYEWVNEWDRQILQVWLFTFLFPRHAEVMKKIIETVAEGGGELGVHMYPSIYCVHWLMFTLTYCTCTWSVTPNHEYVLFCVQGGGG